MADSGGEESPKVHMMFLPKKARSSKDSWSRRLSELDITLDEYCHPMSATRLCIFEQDMGPAHAALVFRVLKTYEIC
jgi:hypothetical protein